MAMTKMIAYCGLDCTKCDALKATQTRNLALKRTIAERWTKELTTKIGPFEKKGPGNLEMKLQLDPGQHPRIEAEDGFLSAEPGHLGLFREFHVRRVPTGDTDGKR